jgi:hypothetical protein
MRRLLFAAAVLVLLAGFQLFVFTGRTGTFFAWTIVNPLAAAFLGAGYWASVSIEALAGRQSAWANARIAVLAVLVFTVLTLAASRFSPWPPHSCTWASSISAPGSGLERRSSPWRGSRSTCWSRC